MLLNIINYITLSFNTPIGKMSALSIGLRKRTSGPFTGYLVLVPYDLRGNNLIDTYYGGIATEFFEMEPDFKELFDKMKKIIKI